MMEAETPRHELEQYDRQRAPVRFVGKEVDSDICLIIHNIRQDVVTAGRARRNLTPPGVNVYLFTLDNRRRPF
jgi:hypothetical protein